MMRLNRFFFFLMPHYAQKFIPSPIPPEERLVIQDDDETEAKDIIPEKPEKSKSPSIASSSRAPARSVTLASATRRSMRKVKKPMQGFSLKGPFGRST